MASSEDKWKGFLTSPITVWITFSACLVPASVLLGNAITRVEGGLEGEDRLEVLTLQVFVSQAFMHFLACYFALISVIKTGGGFPRFLRVRSSQTGAVPGKPVFHACILISVCTGIAAPIVYSAANGDIKDAYATCLSFISVTFSAMASGSLAMKIAG